MEKYVKRSSQRVVALLAAASFALAACGSDTDTADAPAEEPAAEEPAAEEPAAEDDGGIDYAAVSGTLIGAGASSQKAGMLGWQVGFQSVAPSATVEYDPIGSGGGHANPSKIVTVRGLGYKFERPAT